MENLKAIEKIREFIKNQSQFVKELYIYEKTSNFPDFFKKANIRVDIENFNQIILKEETALELGGVNKKSFSLVFPINEIDLVIDGQITLIGKEMDQISDKSIDFGLFILIGSNKITEKDFDALRHFNFISNSIDGFMIRTIPRRFWCRISKNIINNFSFEFLGNAIMHLYKQKFKDSVNSIEIIFINSYPDIIDEFMDVSQDIRNYLDLKWKDKIEKWKKRIDCDYEWECDACPYYDTCEEIKEVLEERNKIGD